MFIQTEATPNPATLKFLPGCTVLEVGTMDFRDAAMAVGVSSLADALFAVDGVTGVFFGTDFITVSKRDERDWQHLKPALLGVIMEHFMSGAPVLTGDAASRPDPCEDFSSVDEATVTKIKELLETHVRPAVARDGGDIVFQGYRNGVVFLHMRGACAGCPSSTATLKNGIENLLRHFIPDVQEVRSV